ncbi:hypothetical protein QTA57_12400 [Fontisubflavum oceani]|uniref:hypothetical protein n=1 Tax=Fontisubflavum oceani TaxID=2978973 RepID=UPI0025B33715|nr:hypothetical protein [Fontisubflavum oceani]WJY20631.1 hypothetical protein QTA57_12400 [Fontisubflavum oceani]
MAVDRTQTGVRLYTPLLKTLKGLAEYLDMTLSDLLEGIILHGLENKQAFTDEQLEVIGRIKGIYGCDWVATDSHMHPDQEGKDGKR